MVIHCTTLSSFLYILKFFILKLEKTNKRCTGRFSSGNSSLPGHRHWELLFYETLLLVIHSQLPQRHGKSLCHGKCLSYPGYLQFQPPHTHKHFLFRNDWALALFTTIKFVFLGNGRRDWIKLHVVFLYCIYHQTSCKSTRERKYQAVSNFWFQPLPKKIMSFENCLQDKWNTHLFGSGIWTRGKICLPNDHRPVVHLSFITLG